MLETENVFHRFHDGDGWLPVNTTTVLDRNINDSNWTIGGTPFAGLMYHDRLDAYNSIIDATLYNKTSASCPDTNNMFGGEFPGIESHTVCRTRMKQYSCNISSRSNNTLRPEWCYLEVIPGSSGGELISNHDLLPIAIAELDYVVENVTVWMTEGRPLRSNGRFSDSITFVFSSTHSDYADKLIVRSRSATLKTATASSSGWSVNPEFSPDLTILNDYLSYHENGRIKKESPKMFLCHENWLDSMHEQLFYKNMSWRWSEAGKRPAPRPTGPQKEYIRRTELKPAKYHENSNWSPLVCLAFSIIYPEGTAETAVSPFQTNMLYYYNATDFELHVGGTYHGFLLHLERSLTQYTGVPPRIPPRRPTDSSSPSDARALDGLHKFHIPTSQEPLLRLRIPHINTHIHPWSGNPLDPCSVRAMRIYMAMLPGQYHPVLEVKTGVRYAMPGQRSFYQCCRKHFAGIGLDRTLSQVIKIRDMGGNHLELDVLVPGDTAKGSVVDKDKQYGYLGRRRRRNRKKKRN
ncbi:uncharacterized protein H6S33_001016 [Morchella sextelata]|uniref:uncharacterized protein n=1 Tax=Morchella sextelata TaxID=1174677 RepID=UPI001D0406A8|nr:uncharacterized protein H6S33_001016 [Morchella sextelata]KAH0608788.1 hypothetical protein H6S33_001016 [Morchella sextelata]